MVKMDHCDPAETATPADEVAVSTAGVFECCGLKFNFVIGKLEGKVFSDQPPVVATIANTHFGPPEFLSKDRYEVVAYQPPLFADPDIHIKNCIFRI